LKLGKNTHSKQDCKIQ